MNNEFKIIKKELLTATVVNINTVSSLGDYESSSDRMIREISYKRCVELLNGTGLEMKDKFLSEKQINFYTFRIIENNNAAYQSFIKNTAAMNAAIDAKTTAKSERKAAHATEMRDIATEVAKELGITKKALFEGLKKNSKVLNNLRFKGIYNIDEIQLIINQ